MTIRTLWRLLRMALAMFAMWAVTYTAFRLLPTQRASSAMLLLLCVLAIATSGDRPLAIAASVATSFSFNYYFIDAVGWRITSSEGAVMFLCMLTTALTGTQLSLRIQSRAAESERLRAEMEKLQRLGAALLSADTVREAAEKAVQEIAGQFGGGVALRVAGIHFPFQAGIIDPAGPPPIVVRTANREATLELYGIRSSIDVGIALMNLIGLVLDRAAAEESRTRLETAQRGEELHNTILNALAHNFRTPLTCIKAAASVMRGSDGVPGAWSQDLVEVIDEEADRLDELIRNSLNLAKIQARRESPRREACSLAAIVSRVLDKMSHYLTSRILIVEIPDDLPPVRGDRFLLEQMVTQVLDNAWKYTAAGARIWISVDRPDYETILTIRNEGNQIPEEENALVFDRFYRGKRSRGSIEGTGLGLAIAKTIAEAHSGRVWIESSPEGPAFRFALPAGAPEVEYDREPHRITHRR